MDSGEEDCPDLVPLPPPLAPTAAAASRKIPVTIITGFLGQCQHSHLVLY